MIKTIIFDNCGVLSNSDAEDGFKSLADFFSVSEEKVISVWQGRLENELDGGKITTNKFLKTVINELNPKVDFNKLKKMYLKRYGAKEDVRELAKRLGKDFETCLLTNFGDYYEDFDKLWNMDRIFDEDKIIVSYKLKMIKPDEDIYFYTLKKIGKKPEETVFIDDNKDNVDTAKRLGMHAILFKSIEQLEKDLEKILESESVLSS
ncbi:HAD family phosphatase [candidate division WS5 bacterium]|uniref:HAD family phosphatase n=1 Tax=candidate division WS5 bacterium TaxID=2093353 RepID=A0A419DGA8_9BACT|nr:MAG: HAD family phosphatase [candidate division WS5 bacterium]